MSAATTPKGWINDLTGIVDEIGGCLLFIREIIKTALTNKLPVHQIFVQIWRVTLQSVATTAMAGFFVGGIFTIQFALQVKAYGALAYLGGLATSACFREIGPLLIAFMLSGKLGAYTSAELGTMRVTEQIDAVRCLGANPYQEIILPRIIGIIVSSFFLLAAGLAMSTFGGLLIGWMYLGISPEEYLRHIPTIVTLPSILSGLFKCFVFALVLSTICTYKGYTTTGGAKGVGLSVVNTAVSTMIGLVVADWLTSQIAEAVLNMAVGL